MEPQLCFIKKSYFEDNTAFVKMLDVGNADKQASRTHLCLMIKNNGNKYYIPLRNNLGPELRKFGRIGHAIPSDKRKNAGLDFRYTLVINDETYIEYPEEKRIPKSQYEKLKKDYDIIQAEFAVYLRGFIKAVRKKRYNKEPLYRESSLINFLYELELL